MADTKQNHDPNEMVLVAYATVHWDDGETLEIFPFADPDDVKSKVDDLVADWARTGFLMRGGQIYPWRRVQRIEVTRVVEMTRGELERQREQDGTLESERQQISFWKTKQAREKKSEDKEAGESGGGKAM